MNTKPTPLELANRLIATATPGGSIFDNNKDAFRVFGMGNGITISKEHAQAYTMALQHLLESNKDILHSYSMSTFEKRVVGLIVPHVIDGTQLQQQDIRAFLQELVAVPATGHDVYRPIFGVILDTTKGPVDLGPYRVFDTFAHAAELAAEMDGREGDLELDPKPQYVIRTQVFAREDAKALELADAQFETFERVIRFMMGIGNRYEVGVLNYREAARRQSLVLSAEHSSTSHGRDQFTQPLPLHNPVFTDGAYGFDRIWCLLGTSTRNEVEGRLLLAVEWIGQSLSERVPSSAFFKATIALEILFTPQKSDLITPSILAQISESVALLMGEDAQSRHELEALAKRLYGLRSKIAHAGKTDVNLDDLFTVQDLASAVVRKLLTAEALQSVSKAADLQQLFKSMKYGCPGIV